MKTLKLLFFIMSTMMLAITPTHAQNSTDTIRFNGRVIDGPLFESTTIYDREITLFDFPREFAGVNVSIAGVSIAGGTTSTNPDCLIWDIVGDG